MHSNKLKVLESQCDMLGAFLAQVLEELQDEGALLPQDLVNRL
jgi:hypothetical protein